MDLEKLDKVVVTKYKRGWDTSFKSGFEKGVEWLMSQPLSERLTDEEIIKIKTIYKLAEKANNKFLLTYFKENFNEVILKNNDAS